MMFGVFSSRRGELKKYQDELKLSLEHNLTNVKSGDLCTLGCLLALQKSCSLMSSQSRQRLLWIASYFLQIQTYTSIFLVIDRITLFNLSPMFWLSFYNRLPVICLSIPFDRGGVAELIRLVGRLINTHFCCSIYKFCVGLRPGLCDDHYKTNTVLSLRYFITYDMIMIRSSVENPLVHKLYVPDC